MGRNKTLAIMNILKIHRRGKHRGTGSSMADWLRQWILTQEMLDSSPASAVYGYFFGTYSP